MEAMEYKFTNENFEEEVVKSDIPVLVDFYADWCGPCKMMGPVVEKLAEEFDGKVKVGKVNVDEQEDLAARFNVMSIPFFAFIKDGKMVDSSLGASSKDALVAKLEALL
jgi:thioredoxin 1